MTIPNKKTGIAAIILTKNEERDLPGCLESLRSLCSRIVVIDSGSIDRTANIAKACCAIVLDHPFTTHADQVNWAIENAGITEPWTLRIDADERLSPELMLNLAHITGAARPELSGILVPRRTVFLGTPLRWGGTYPVWLLRVWRTGQGRCENTRMDEHIILKAGTTEKARGDLLHLIPKSLSEWTGKHDWYAERECQDILEQRSSSPQGPIGQARLKRLLKTRLYLRLPLLIRPFLYWAYRYILLLGILDGKSGLIYHCLQAFWYRFLVDAKLVELQKNQLRQPVNQP